MKKFIFLISFIGFPSLFSSCSAGYVAEEPTYVEVSRPIAPDPTYIWVDDGWRWNQQRALYIRNEGRWAQPRPGRTYSPGHWNKTNRGNQWRSGGWRR